MCPSPVVSFQEGHLVLLFMPEEEYSWHRVGPAQLPLKIHSPLRKQQVQCDCPFPFPLRKALRSVPATFLPATQSASVKDMHFPGLPEAEESSLKVLSSVQACGRNQHLGKQMQYQILKNGYMFSPILKQ